MRVVALGVHVLDMLVRHVEEIPEGQGSQLVEQIKITAAGTAAGTALTLAKLGAQVHSAGAVGTDAAGDLLLSLLERGGVDTSEVVRRTQVQTSASVLPIRPNSERPAFHVIGANAGYTLDDVPWERIANATHLHLGGPEFLGGAVAATGEFSSPSLAADVVDTTGCGDAFSAGYLRGISLGQSPLEAAGLGNAAAGLVAGGLGSDHGDFDLSRAQRLVGG